MMKWIKRDLPVIAVIITAMIDRIVTSFYFQYEYNPIVASLGLHKWILITILSLILMPVGWYSFQMYKLRYMRIWVYGLATLQTTAIVLNLVGLLLVYFMT